MKYVPDSVEIRAKKISKYSLLTNLEIKNKDTQ